MVKILIGCTGSVATIKLQPLIDNILKDVVKAEVRVCVTEHSKHFFDVKHIPHQVDVFSDSDEWAAWSKRGDPVLHIELAKWADIFLIAPLDANTLAKISTGICDNLLTCTARAWDISKPLIFCPAMNTRMYEHPLTSNQIATLKSWGYLEIPAIEKLLICGDTGPGAMAEVSTIVKFLIDTVSNKIN
ncbi:phosphopantothenoylcysteine decarboxylase [Anoplophora glabripennis]|nr:phosphopantothenoylcysteine decarboxylase [Anoplophora glabripennis]